MCLLVSCFLHDQLELVMKWAILPAGGVVLPFYISSGRYEACFRMELGINLIGLSWQTSKFDADVVSCIFHYEAFLFIFRMELCLC